MSAENDERQNAGVERERWSLLREIDKFTEMPLIVLSFAWLVLLIIDLTMGLTGWLGLVIYVIWILFIMDFLIELVIAPKRFVYLRHNWLTALALMLPALRILRIFRVLRLLRAARAARSVNMVRILTSTRRGVRATRATLGRRGFTYVVVVTFLVLFISAAGMAQFESPSSVQQAGHDQERGIESYSEALWWTAMMITTFGSDYWPLTPEGRLLTVLLSIYSVAIFGYITATLASIFVAGDVSAEAERQSRRPRSTTQERR